MKSVTRSVLASSAAMIIALAAAQMWTSEAAPAPQARQVPKFEVDRHGPSCRAKWVFGQVSSISIDEQGHAWVLQRPSTVRTDQKDKAAPPVLEFDEAGNFVQGWGGPGQGFDWPETEHGIYVDPKGFVWIGGTA